MDLHISIIVRILSMITNVDMYSYGFCYMLSKQLFVIIRLQFLLYNQTSLLLSNDSIVFSKLYCAEADFTSNCLLSNSILTNIINLGYKQTC